MDRREIIHLLTAGAAGLWAGAPFLRAAARQSTASPDLLPLFPLNELVLLPQTILPLHIFEERYKEMIKDCLDNRWEFGMLYVEDRSIQTIGCTASITEVLEKYPNGEMDILVRGERRFEISEPNDDKSYLRGKPHFFADDPLAAPSDPETRKHAIDLYGQLKELAERDQYPLPKRSPTLEDVQLSFQMMAGVPAELRWKQDLLELRSERERLDKVIAYFEELIKTLREDPPGPPVRII
jgi:Lon protease-like protein